MGVEVGASVGPAYLRVNVSKRLEESWPFKILTERGCSGEKD